jgi:hypothetical protein
MCERGWRRARNYESPREKMNVDVLHLQELCQAVAVGCNRLASDRLDVARLAELAHQIDDLVIVATRVELDLFDLLRLMKKN